MTTLEERFLEKLAATDTGCWEWQGGRNKDGYGQSSFFGRQVLTHRFAYEMWRGPVAGFHVLHSCDNPPCCNPDHLRLGSNLDNVRDAIDRGRREGVSGQGIRYVPKGNNGCHHVLTARDVLSIRHRHSAGDSYLKIAEDFGVTKSCVSQIVRKVIWKNL